MAYERMSIGFLAGNIIYDIKSQPKNYIRVTIR
jgi:hypothetical protein